MLTAGVILGVSTTSALAHEATANASTRNGSVVTVEAGDTLSKIATTYNTTVNQLVQDNSIANQDLIYVGQQLNLMQGQTTTQATTKQTTTPVSQPTTNQTSQVTSQTTTTQASQPVTTQSGSEQSAKAWIAQHESGGSYTAQNENYYGKYQLSSSYLNGDYSAANQERVADQYVQQRYGSWANAKAHWLANNWY